MNKRRYLAVGVGLAVLMFVSAGAGAMLALRWQERRLAVGPPFGPARMMMERLNRLESTMDLSLEQRRAVAPALMRARDEVRSLGEETARRSMEIRRRMRAEIEPILTPSQRARWARAPGIPMRAWQRSQTGGAAEQQGPVSATEPPP